MTRPNATTITQATSFFDATIGRPPDAFGKFELLKKIGGGGMGQVYRAVHVAMKRPTAIKLLPNLDSQDSATVSRFQREIEVIASLDHPNIVHAYDAGEFSGWRYLVMELVHGESLQAVVRTPGVLSVGHACEITRQAALGLQYAHDRGIVHRDIKPSNLMLASSGIIKILDMGISRLCDDAADLSVIFVENDVAFIDPEETALTATGQFLGTPAYVAPEQCGDAAHVDARADVFGLAATLYCLLVGSSPRHIDVSKSFDEIKSQIMACDFVPVNRARPDIPDAVSRAIMRSLNQRPEDRFETILDLSKELEPYATASGLSKLVSGR